MAQGTTRGVPIDTDPLLAADSDLLVPSQKAVKSYAQPQLNGVGFVKASGTTISYDNSTYLTSAITSLNGLTTSSQTFAAPGTTGTAPSWSSSTSIHTLNIPLASTTSVTAGLISKTDYDTFNGKLTSSLTSGNIFVGNGSNVATGVALGGDGSLSNAGSLTVTGLRGVALPTLGASAGLLKYTGTGTNTWVFDTNTYSTAIGANPSASIGLTAINGSSTNFMRADGAPALSQSIAPTWTGKHIFNPTINDGVVISPTFTASANNQRGIFFGGTTTMRSTSNDVSSQVLFGGATTTPSNGSGQKLYGVNFTSTFTNGANGATISPLAINATQTVNYPTSIYASLFINSALSQTASSEVYQQYIGGSITNSSGTASTPIGMFKISGTLADNNGGSSSILRPIMFNTAISVPTTTVTPFHCISFVPTITCQDNVDQTQIFMNISPTHSQGRTNNYTFMNMAPTYGAAGSQGGNLTLRGLYYNPTITQSLSSHIAWQNTTGDILFGTTSGSTGIGATTTINASAILQVTSTTKGFLPPRMTNAQRTAISSPAIGLIVYCTDTTEGLYINKSTGWTFII